MSCWVTKMAILRCQGCNECTLYDFLWIEWLYYVQVCSAQICLWEVDQVKSLRGLSNTKAIAEANRDTHSALLLHSTWNWNGNGIIWRLFLSVLWSDTLHRERGTLAPNEWNWKLNSTAISSHNEFDLQKHYFCFVNLLARLWPRAGFSWSILGTGWWGRFLPWAHDRGVGLLL